MACDRLREERTLPNHGGGFTIRNRLTLAGNTRPCKAIINLRQYSVEKFRIVQLSMLAIKAIPFCSVIRSCCVMWSITKIRLSMISDTDVSWGTYRLGRIMNTLDPARVSRPGQGKIVLVASWSWRVAALRLRRRSLTLHMSFSELSTSKLQKCTIRRVWALVNFLRISSFSGMVSSWDWIVAKINLSFGARFNVDARFRKDETVS